MADGSHQGADTGVDLTAMYTAAAANPVSLSGLTPDEAAYLSSQSAAYGMTAQAYADLMGQEAGAAGESLESYLGGIVTNVTKGAAEQGQTFTQALASGQQAAQLIGPVATLNNGQQAVSPAQAALIDNEANYGSLVAPGPSTFSTVLSGLSLAAGLGVIAAPVAVAAGAALGGGVAGGVAGGAAAGAVGGAATGYVSGNVGAGALKGAESGAIGAGIGSAARGLGVTSALTGAGVNPTLAAGITKAGTGALGGAVRGALNGSGAASGALIGGVNAAANAGLNYVAGSILSGAGTIFQNNPAANPQTSPANNGPATQSAGNQNMDATDQGNGSTPYEYSGDGTNDNNLTSGLTDTQLMQLGLIAPSGDLGLGNPGYTDLNIEGGGSTLQGDNPGYENLNIQGGGTTLGGLNLSALLGHPAAGGSSGTSSGTGTGSTGSSLLGSLASLLTGSGSSGTSSLLAQLLGLGATGAGTALNSDAAKAAAGSFANSTQYNPYAISTNNGNTTFDNGQATSTLSPSTQANANSLNGLVGSSAASLNGGTAGAAQGYFDNLQKSQRQNNDQFYQSNLDNQFANGVLSSTAGQYQSKAALDAINTQTANDQVLANNFANTQQQNQLATLTGSLNGLNSINTGQLSQIGAGTSAGTAKSGANSVAFQPTLAANAGSVVGNLLNSQGNAALNSGNSSNSMATLIANLLGGGG